MDCNIWERMAMIVLFDWGGSGRAGGREGRFVRGDNRRMQLLATG